MTKPGLISGMIGITQTMRQRKSMTQSREQKSGTRRPHLTGYSLNMIQRLRWLKVGLLLLVVSLLGCAKESVTPSPSYSNNAAKVPALNPSSLQGPAPEFCSPSCLESLTKQRQTMQQRLTAQGGQG
ncbi:outer-membrane spanin protein Rz1 [Pantoea phage vB_PagS_MED16]|nr:outer-membrane spanin protein Rz1 [Pantoea phage vB_PagS_MED16]